MFNYKRQNCNYKRFKSEDYMPRIIDKIYKSGEIFPYAQKNIQMNYSIKLNKLKISTKELNNEIKLYRDDLDNIFIDNKKISSQLKNNYHNVRKELNNNINTIKLKIEEHNIQQKNFNQNINNEFLNFKQSNKNIQDLINNISIKLEKLQKKILYKDKNIENKSKNNKFIKKDA